MSPRLRLLSLGAGVQSTALLLLAVEGRLPGLDAAIFSDTGWEPGEVYRHLDRLEREIAQPAGIPIFRVSAGNIRDDVLDPARRFASMPLFVRNPDGTVGMIRRQCTAEYKVKPIKKKVRALLGYPSGRVPDGVFAEQWIGISTDEFTRAKDSGIRYAVNRHPLLELGRSRADCLRYLADNGWASTPKSACVGCPFRTDAEWRRMRDTDPASWAAAVAFDRAIRSGGARATEAGTPLRGDAYLHRSCVPLDVALIDRVTAGEWRARQGSLIDLLDPDGDERPTGCSPWTCRSGDWDADMPEPAWAGAS